ncbi:MAG TPA: potassium/proton antiporter [Steroidobacteraceae bacterium]|nr:potassium/proton antiporter [Steroidobacteraceae bacterium]
MGTIDQIILVTGVLSLLAVFAGVASVRLGAPLLLGLIAVGMLAGEDGPGGIDFGNFQAGYLIGSVALAVILFQGGVATERWMLKRALWPSVLLATAGVAVSAAVVAAAARLALGMSWPEGLLLGATVSPTDAAAVSVQLRFSRVGVPARVAGALELESGLNDPMSVFLTLTLVELMRRPGSFDLGNEVLRFLREMGVGAAIGVVGGYALLRVYRRLRIVRSAFPLLALGCTLTVFGGAQLVGASGFLASYLTGMVVGNYEHPAARPVGRFFETLGWLAQNSLFLMLGLLITPHRLPPLLGAAAFISVILIILARPLAATLCLVPFGWSIREVAFISWAGLRGAVPIYLTIIPLLEGLGAGRRLFEIVFVVVIISVAAQAPTLRTVARLLGLREEKPG